ncbi:MAG: hypothetical protein AAGA18_03605, partial [Verrucomicrobiota bacterium]
MCKDPERIKPMGLLKMSCLSSLTFYLSTVELASNPSGGNVVSGSATISTNGSTLTINQGSDRVIIDWQNFSIQVGETTTFMQPSEMSA